MGYKKSNGHEWHDFCPKNAPQKILSSSLPLILLNYKITIRKKTGAYERTIINVKPTLSERPKNFVQLKQFYVLITTALTTTFN